MHLIQIIIPHAFTNLTYFYLLDARKHKLDWPFGIYFHSEKPNTPGARWILLHAAYVNEISVIV